MIHQHEGSTHLWIAPVTDREPAGGMMIPAKRVGDTLASDVCVSGSLTATRPPGRTSGISWPDGGINTPGHGATRAVKVMRWNCDIRRPAPGRGGSI